MWSLMIEGKKVSENSCITYMTLSDDYFQMTSGQCCTCVSAKWNTSTLAHFISKPRGLQSHKRDINRLWWCFRTLRRGNYFFAHTMALHMNPIQICFGGAQMNVKAEHLTDQYVFITGSGCLGKNLLVVDRRERLHVHITMMNGGHKLMSLTYCTYLFLCVTMSHYAPMGIKHAHWYQEMHYVVEQKARYMMPQLIWVETLLLTWGLLWQTHTVHMVQLMWTLWLGICFTI